MADATAREKEVRARVFTIGGGTPVDITTSTLVELLRSDNNGNEDSTDDSTGLLTVTDASAGEVTFAPNAAWWAEGAKWYDICMTVTIAGVVTTYPSVTNLRFNIVKALD